LSLLAADSSNPFRIPSASKATLDPGAFAHVVALLAELTRASPGNSLEFAQLALPAGKGGKGDPFAAFPGSGNAWRGDASGDGIAATVFILRRLPGPYITADLWKSTVRLVDGLLAHPPRANNMGAVAAATSFARRVHSVLFDLQIWSRAPFPVQAVILHDLVTFTKCNPVVARRACRVEQLLEALKTVYTVDEEDNDDDEAGSEGSEGGAGGAEARERRRGSSRLRSQASADAAEGAAAAFVVNAPMDSTAPGGCPMNLGDRLALRQAVMLLAEALIVGGGVPGGGGPGGGGASVVLQGGRRVPLRMGVGGIDALLVALASSMTSDADKLDVAGLVLSLLERADRLPGVLSTVCKSQVGRPVAAGTGGGGGIGVGGGGAGGGKGVVDTRSTGSIEEIILCSTFAYDRTR
jgi:hypothetical protein